MGITVRYAQSFGHVVYSVGVVQEMKTFVYYKNESDKAETYCAR